MGKNYYEILGVSKNATKEEIKKAYKKLAKKYHPDISKEADAEQKFKDINEAAGVLLDDGKKQRFDQYGSADGPQGFGGGSSGGFNPQDFGINIDDIFEQFGFGGFGGGSSRGHQGRSQVDTRVFSEVELSLEDVYFGVEKEVSIRRNVECKTCDGSGAKDPSKVKTCSKCSGSGVVIGIQRSILGAIRTQQTCPDCSGSGSIVESPCSDCSGLGTDVKVEDVSVKIPKGIESGVSLKVTGKGSYDVDTKSYGDLYIKIYIQRDSKLDVDGNDLYMNLDVNFIQAILGDEIEFKHFDKTLSLKIPNGTQPSTILRLKGKGLPYFNYNGYGDLYVKVNVEIPKKTSKEQKKFLLDYAKTLKDKNFFKRVKSLFN